MHINCSVHIYRHIVGEEHSKNKKRKKTANRDLILQVHTGADTGFQTINNKTSGGGGGLSAFGRYYERGGVLSACVRSKHKVFGQKRGL